MYKSFPLRARGKVINDLILNHKNKVDLLSEEIIKLKKRCYYCPTTINLNPYGYIAICNECLNHKGGPPFLENNDRITNPRLDEFSQNGRQKKT